MSNTRVIKEDIRRQETIRRKRNKRKRKLQRQKHMGIMLLVFLIIIIVVVLINGNESDKKVKESVKLSHREDSDKNENVDIDLNAQDRDVVDDGVVEAPKERNITDILNVLQEMSENNATINEVYTNYRDYPEDLLSLLANNHETADFVLGYNDKSSIKEFEDNKEYVQYPLIMQWDTRWGYKEYGDSIIGLAGCGPTCVSMVAQALTYDYSITPDVVAEYSEKNGHYVNGTGTSWSLMTEGAKEYGLNVKEVVLDEAAMKEEIDNGKIIISALGEGDFTTKGHFIVIYAYDEDGFYVNDPNCKYRSSIPWSYDKLNGQIKMLWSYWING